MSFNEAFRPFLTNLREGGGVGGRWISMSAAEYQISSFTDHLRPWRDIPFNKLVNILSKSHLRRRRKFCIHWGSIAA
jgi:hypothetical protein